MNPQIDTAENYPVKEESSEPPKQSEPPTNRSGRKLPMKKEPAEVK